MRAASRRAEATLHARQDEVLGGSPTADSLTKLADELYSVAGLLATQPRLRRILGDPATDSQGRQDLLARLVGSQLDAAGLEIAQAAVGLRWSRPWDLADALERAGDGALLAAADQSGQLDRVEDELFRLERIVQADGQLGALLDEYTAPVSARVSLLDSLVEGKVAAVTLTLLRHAVGSPRKRSIDLALDELLELAAARQERSIARVLSAVPLSAAQEERLAAALTQLYGRAMSVRVALDPRLGGGLIVRVGDEIIDGSIASRFSAARAELIG
jgi:F-type H+-transporting ATPase subunit delta